MAETKPRARTHASYRKEWMVDYRENTDATWAQAEYGFENFIGAYGGECPCPACRAYSERSAK